MDSQLTKYGVGKQSVVPTSPLFINQLPFSTIVSYSPNRARSSFAVQ
jgi:hypothetical protein